MHKVRSLIAGVLLLQAGAAFAQSNEFATVTPLQWKGSADLYSLARANALLVRPENDPVRATGDVIQCLQIP